MPWFCKSWSNALTFTQICRDTYFFLSAFFPFESRFVLTINDDMRPLSLSNNCPKYSGKDLNQPSSSVVNNGDSYAVPGTPRNKTWKMACSCAGMIAFSTFDSRMVTSKETVPEALKPADPWAYRHIGNSVNNKIRTCLMNHNAPIVSPDSALYNKKDVGICTSCLSHVQALALPPPRISNRASPRQYE